MPYTVANWQNLNDREVVDVQDKKGRILHKHVRVEWFSEDGQSARVHGDKWPKWESLTLHREDGWELLRK